MIVNSYGREEPCILVMDRLIGAEAGSSRDRNGWGSLDNCHVDDVAYGALRWMAPGFEFLFSLDSWEGRDPVVGSIRAAVS